MLIALIRREFLDHVLSLRFLISTGMCALIMTVGFSVRIANFDQELEIYRRDSDLSRRELSQREYTSSVLFEPTYVYEPPNPLRIFVEGRNDAPSRIRMVFNRIPMADSNMLRQSAWPFFPAIDLVRFVGVVMSLIAIVFGYDAICGERENGTLRLLMSYSVPRHLVLLSKWLGGYLALIIPYILGVAILTGVVFLRTKMSFTPAMWMRLGGIVGLSFLYLAAVYSIAICVSTFTRQSATSVMVLAALWVVLVLAIPNASVYAANAIMRTTPIDQIEFERTASVSDIWDSMVSVPMSKYKGGRDGVKDYQWQHQIQLSLAASLERHATWAKFDDETNGQLDRSALLARNLARLSPFGSFSIAAAELADRGSIQKQWLNRQVRDFHRTWIRYAHEQHLEDMAFRMKEGKMPQPWPQWRKAAIPEFHYEPLPPGTAVAAQAVDIMVLAAVTIAFCLMSLLKFLRYDVR